MYREIREDTDTPDEMGRSSVCVVLRYTPYLFEIRYLIKEVNNLYKSKKYITKKEGNMNIESGICLDLDAAIIRIQELGKGKILYLRHQVYGEYLVKCNPQGNRFFATPVKGTKAHEQVVNNVEGFILWGYGDWSIVTSEQASDIEYPVCPECKRRL